MFTSSEVNRTQSTSKYEQHSFTSCPTHSCKDTQSIVLVYPVKYLVKWVSILNSRNSDDL